MVEEPPLIVLLGAGASAASGDYELGDLPPPLTVDLFREGRYGTQLQKYDLAHQAGRHINRERTNDSSLALEHVLYALRTSEHLHHQQMALAVPPYLQDLLHAVSSAHYADAFRYDHLIERLLRLPYVYFITLNYDVLLDRRLNNFHRLSMLEDYITGSNKWSLIKLHGSVNWYYTASTYFEPAAPPGDLQWNPLHLECALPNSSLEKLRGASPSSTDRYPALAMPEGPKDKLIAPSRHLWFLKNSLQSARRADLLVIGYSGLDGEALELLSSSQCEIRRMTVVNLDQNSAAQVASRLGEAGLSPIWTDIRREDFAAWADGGGLNQLIDEYGGPYP